MAEVKSFGFSDVGWVVVSLVLHEPLWSGTVRRWTVTSVYNQKSKYAPILGCSSKKLLFLTLTFYSLE